jgi:ABC-2 type transport system ATP-binding protein
MISIRHLTKTYNGKPALTDLCLDIPDGEVFGYIGPNGAGKTTTIRILATLLKPTGGAFEIDGTSDVRAIRRLVGYMPDVIGFEDDIKVWEYLDFFCGAYKLPKPKRPGLIADVLALTDLTEKRDAYVETLSRGMQQRLMLAKTLLHDPKVLVLDEPASGLDPRARIELRELLKTLRGMGKTIFISSHILSELADFCTLIGIIEHGRLLAAGRLEEIQRGLSAAKKMRIKFVTAVAAAVTFLQAQPAVAEVEPVESSATFFFHGDDAALGELLAGLAQHGHRFVSVEELSRSLDHVFLSVTKGQVA